MTLKVTELKAGRATQEGDVMKHTPWLAESRDETYPSEHYNVPF